MTFLHYNNYTSIPHDSLKNNMNILIDEAFKVRGAQYLSCNNNNTQKAALAKLPLTTHPHERAEPHTLQTQIFLVIIK